MPRTRHVSVEEDSLLTQAEAAVRLGISTRTLQRLMANGEITCVRPRSRTVYFQQRDIDAYLHSTRTSA